jgi:hypothetical protein
MSCGDWAQLRRGFRGVAPKNNRPSGACHNRIVVHRLRREFRPVNSLIEKLDNANLEGNYVKNVVSGGKSQRNTISEQHS